MSRRSAAPASLRQASARPTATLDEIDIRTFLDARPRRAPDFAREDRAYAALAAEMADNPRNLLQKLVEVAVDLCAAHTAARSRWRRWRRGDIRTRRSPPA